MTGGVGAEGERETPLPAPICCAQLSKSKRPCLNAAVQLAQRAAGGHAPPELIQGTAHGRQGSRPVPCMAASPPTTCERGSIKCICHLPPRMCLSVQHPLGHISKRETVPEEVTGASGFPRPLWCQHTSSGWAGAACRQSSAMELCCPQHPQTKEFLPCDFPLAHTQDNTAPLVAAAGI